MCKAVGCQVTPMGVNLAKHYNACTDWVLFNELKAYVGDENKKLKACLKIGIVCRFQTLGMQILNFRYANMDFFKTPHI